MLTIQHITETKLKLPPKRSKSDISLSLSKGFTSALMFLTI